MNENYPAPNGPKPENYESAKEELRKWMSDPDNTFPATTRAGTEREAARKQKELLDKRADDLENIRKRYDISPPLFDSMIKLIKEERAGNGVDSGGKHEQYDKQSRPGSLNDVMPRVKREPFKEREDEWRRKLDQNKPGSKKQAPEDEIAAAAG